MSLRPRLRELGHLLRREAVLRVGGHDEVLEGAGWLAAVRRVVPARVPRRVHSGGPVEALGCLRDRLEGVLLLPGEVHNVHAQCAASLLEVPLYPGAPGVPGDGLQQRHRQSPPTIACCASPEIFRESSPRPSSTCASSSAHSSSLPDTHSRSPRPWSSANLMEFSAWTPWL